MEEKVFAPYDRVVKFLLPIIPKRLTPNQITFFRLVMVPVLIAFLILEDYRIALPLFIVLALTDVLDGSLARLRDQITAWGKIWDPIADKLLIGSVVVVLLLRVNIILTILLLIFEAMFIIGGAFNLAARNTHIQANKWGKIKMNLQVVGAALLILGLVIGSDKILFSGECILYVSLLFSVVSLFKKGI